MEQFPFTDADAGVAALMRLVTIVTTEVLHGAVIGNDDFINGKETEAFASKALVSLLACISACFCKTVLA